MQHKLTIASRVLVPVAALAAALTVLVIAFAWPTSELGPRDVPVAVTGSADFVTRTSDAVAHADDDAFDVRVAPDEDAAEQLLRDNEVDGVIEETGSGPHLVLAQAGRPAVARLLTEVQGRLVGADFRPAVSDAVPGPSDDPHSAVFSISALPTMLGAIAVGVALALLAGGRWVRLVRIVLVAVVSGITLTLVMNNWFGAVTGHWWAAAGCYALAVGAVVGAINGLHNVFGRVGLMSAAAVVMLLGNPLSSATSAPELLPNGWSSLGEALPPGATTGALRAISFYGDNGASTHLFVLGAWFVVGLLLLLAGPARSHQGRALPAATRSDRSHDA